MAAKDLRINKKIRVQSVRLIDQDGEQRGVVPTEEALKMAEEADLDLVEVAPRAKPPVCKLINYGKYKYQQDKQNSSAKKKQVQTKLKEVRMQPKIESHDLDFKSKHVQKFINAGNKVKVSIRFRGREFAHTELGKGVLNKILERLDEDSYTVDNKPAMEGRFMTMLLSPRSKK